MYENSCILYLYAQYTYKQFIELCKTKANIDHW